MIILHLEKLFYPMGVEVLQGIESECMRERGLRIFGEEEGNEVSSKYKGIRRGKRGGK